jgi:AraC-like DNA-binding protein
MILSKILPGAGHLIAYHVITEGRCFANIVGEKPIPIEAGEIVVFTKGDPHVMSSGPGMRADRSAPNPLEAATGARLPFQINYELGNGPSAKIVCGFLGCDDRPFNPLLDSLPPVIRAGGRQARDTRWLCQLMDIAALESADHRPGSESVLARLSELMFVEVVRRHLETMPQEQAGWLAGLRDPFVGKALSLIHGNPARNWTIAELSRKTGLSRSVLAQRFSALVGIPPIRYLGKWRMQIAAGLLSGGSAGVAQIAAETGYGSEAAFSRAFRKLVGMTPSAWRHRMAPSESHREHRSRYPRSSDLAGRTPEP